MISRARPVEEHLPKGVSHASNLQPETRRGDKTPPWAVTAGLRGDVPRRPRRGNPRAGVQTGSSNEPAKQLYRREGFEEIDEVEVVPGLRVTRFGRRL